MRITEYLGISRPLMALSLARLADAVGNSTFFIVIPLYVADLPAPWFPFPDSVRTGILISLYGLANAGLQPLAGALTDRFKRRKLFIQGGLTLMGGGTLAFALATQFSHLLVLQAAQGVGVAFTIAASVALLATETEKQTRGGSMGVFSTMRMVGFAIGPLIGGFLYENVGFNSVFFAGGLFIFLGFAVVQAWVKDPPQPTDEGKGGDFRFVDRELLTAGLIALGFATFVMAVAYSMVTTLEQELNTRLN
jgi:MFS family permease